VRRTTKQLHIEAIVQARRLSLFSHSARDETDTTKILTVASWRTGGDNHEVLVLHWWRLSSRTRESNNLSLNEANNVAQNSPLWRLMSTFGDTHP